MRWNSGIVAMLISGLLSGMPAWGESPEAAPKDSKVNINTADEATLAKLPGIGSEGAKAIIEYRTKNGAFAVIDDLKNVPGITDLTVERLGERRLTTGGD